LGRGEKMKKKARKFSLTKRQTTQMWKVQGDVENQTLMPEMTRKEIAYATQIEEFF
jgi:hypothetical protein